MAIRFNFERNSYKENKPNLVYFIKDRCVCAYDQYSINTHTITELIYIIDGEGNARIEDCVYPFSKGDFYVINAYVSHSEYLKKDLGQSFQYFIIGINNLFIKSDKNVGMPVKLSSSHPITHILFEMFDELNNKKPRYQEITQSYFDLLISYILRLYNTENSSEGKIYSLDVVGKVKQYIDINYASNLSSKTLADEFNCNQNTLSRNFKKQVGISIQQYILLKKIELAKNMLETDNISITDLAFHCGFNDSAYFCKYFKKITGISPTMYRDFIRK